MIANDVNGGKGLAPFSSRSVCFVLPGLRWCSASFIFLIAVMLMANALTPLRCPGGGTKVVVPWTRIQGH